MKKLLLPLIASSLTMPALAKEQPVVEEGWKLPTFSFATFDSSNNLTRAQRQARNREERRASAERARNNPYLYKNGPKRTRIFSGIETVDNTYTNAQRISEFKKVYFDGNTRLHNNWRIRYALEETNVARGQDGEQINAPTQWLKLAPRYEQVLSPTANWYSEFEYTNYSGFGRRSGEGSLRNSDSYMVAIGGNKRFGKHNFSASIEHLYREETDYSYPDGDPDIDEEANYLTQGPKYMVGYRYRLNRLVSFQFRHVENTNTLDHRVTNSMGKVSFNHRFGRNLRSELSLQHNTNENHETEIGNRINRVTLFNSYKLTDAMQLEAELSYRKYNRFNPEDRPGSGDRKQLFGKFGVTFHF